MTIIRPVETPVSIPGFLPIWAGSMFQEGNC
jgi:hypothetical protein